jgi:hypothetical protein
MKFDGAFVTKPNKDMWGIRPEERTDFSGNLQSLIDTQALQSLNVEHTVVELALGAFVSVNTLPLTKHLFAHIDSPFPRAATARNTEPSIIKTSGLTMCELKRGQSEPHYM